MSDKSGPAGPVARWRDRAPGSRAAEDRSAALIRDALDLGDPGEAWMGRVRERISRRRRRPGFSPRLLRLALAYVYPDSVTAQDALNAFVWERYGIWKANYIETSDSVCGPGTARVRTDPPKTVSEGQGYGMAISAAIGDKATFDALWNFVRHYLSQAADKYCGGLMGWMWDGSTPCQPLDSPCDPAVASCSGNQDSAFDGDVDIGIGLVYAALQWPSDYKQFAIGWLTKMECEINTRYDGVWNYPTDGDTNDKSCENFPAQPCSYLPGTLSSVHMDYYPPGYFRVFGDYLAANVDSSQKAGNGQSHHDFWYKVAETVYQMLEECYDQPGLNPGLVGASGDTAAPCRNITLGAYEELRSLWRVGIDAAWFGNASLPETAANSSSHYGPKSRMQAKIDNSQDFFNNFYKNNPVEANANRFSSICDSLHAHTRSTWPCAATSACSTMREARPPASAKRPSKRPSPRPLKATAIFRNPWACTRPFS